MKTALYRCFDRAGTLLYAGICTNPAVRCAQHEVNDWWNDVARMSLVWFASRKKAAAAEKRVIKAEKPAYNVQHNGSRKPYPIRGSKTIPPEALILCDQGACHAMVARKMGLDYGALRKALKAWMQKKENR